MKPEYKEKYPHLFEPFTVGKGKSAITFKNRVLVPPMVSVMGHNFLGGINDYMGVLWHGDMARGGFSSICMPFEVPHDGGHPGGLEIDSERTFSAYHTVLRLSLIHIFITQSALSQAISNLEEELGVKLLIRTNRGVTATVFGEIIYSDAKEIIKVVKGYKEKWRAMLDDTSCTSNIRIVAYPSANSILVDNIIPELCNMYPNMDFSVFEEPPSKNEIEIMKRYDATIRRGSWVKPEFEAVREEIERNGYAVDVLCENDPLQLLVSSKSPYAKYESLNESDLKKMSVAFYATEKAPVYLKYFDDAKCFKLQQHGSIMRFVANNGAVAVFPKNIVTVSYTHLLCVRCQSRLHRSCRCRGCSR